jgi:hypothetical protein
MLSQCSGGYKNILVDVKTHWLSKGDRPALSNWHFDNIAWDNPAVREENNLLFISGDFCLTEFLAEDQVLQNGRATLKVLNSQDWAAKKIPARTVVRYGRLAHRASVAERTACRLLIRVSETDKTRPQNKRFDPTYVRAT